MGVSFFVPRPPNRGVFPSHKVIPYLCYLEAFFFNFLFLPFEFLIGYPLPMPLSTCRRSQYRVPFLSHPPAIPPGPRSLQRVPFLPSAAITLTPYTCRFTSSEENRSLPPPPHFILVRVPLYVLEKSPQNPFSPLFPLAFKKGPSVRVPPFSNLLSLRSPLRSFLFFFQTDALT